MARDLSKFDFTSCWLNTRLLKHGNGNDKLHLDYHIKLIRGLRLTKKIIVVNLLLLSNDISLNPGPSVMKSLYCDKSIGKNHARGCCSLCNSNSHLKCLGIGYEINKTCNRCSSTNEVN